MYSFMRSRRMGRRLAYLYILCALLLICGSALAATDKGDDRSLAGCSVARTAMPTLKSGEYGTDLDNENNARTGQADGDMDYYIFNDDPIHPIEFNVVIGTVDPSNRSATIQMNVYDVDTNTIAGNPEIDDVFINGKKVGTLNGADSTWGVNIFNIPIGTLKKGKNLVQIKVDQGNLSSPNWAVTIDWAIIKLAGVTTASPEIPKAWFAPVTVTRGNYINAFAEVSDPKSVVKTVEVFQGSTRLFTLTDPDGDHTWSGQFQIPATWTKGQKTLTIKAKNASGAVVALWPSIKAQ